MTLDDRLRGTYQRQLRQVEDRLAQSGANESFQPNAPSVLFQRVLIGTFVVLAGFGILGAARFIGQPVEPLQASDAPPAESIDDESPPTTTEPLTVETPTSTLTPPSSETPDPVETEPLPHDGVANSVCESGARAELERASLEYVSEATGWGRKDDLVNEQDGPFYFEAWEPNFSEPVSVEISLAEPVLATEIRVFQDPFTEVSGTIGIVTDSGSEFAIELSGVDGWKTHEFPEPELLAQLTVTREQEASNIMEILVCVLPNQ